MKRKDFIRHLSKNGCYLEREAIKYSIFKNPANNVEVSVTRHRELADFSAKKICKELQIKSPF